MIRSSGSSRSNRAMRAMRESRISRASFKTWAEEPFSGVKRVVEAVQNQSPLGIRPVILEYLHAQNVGPNGSI